jgi:hypothetical protein
MLAVPPTGRETLATRTRGTRGRFRRRRPSAAAPPIARSELAENKDAVPTYRYRTASELAREGADREGLVGLEREQFIRDFLTSLVRSSCWRASIAMTCTDPHTAAVRSTL